MAWKRWSRPCLAFPPAETPSTRNSSALAGSRVVQSVNLPGRAVISRADFRLVSSRALRAASRALDAVTAFSTTSRAIAGFSSRNMARASPTAELTIPWTSVLPSLVLVWPSNCGSRSLTLMIAVRPSRTSSPARLGSDSLSSPTRRA